MHIYKYLKFGPFNRAAAESQCLGPIQLVKMFTVIGPTPPVHIWLLTFPLPFHVRDIPSQSSFHLSKTDISLTNTSSSRNKTKPGIIPEAISRRRKNKIIGLHCYSVKGVYLELEPTHCGGYLDVCFLDLSQGGTCLSVTVG